MRNIMLIIITLLVIQSPQMVFSNEKYRDQDVEIKKTGDQYTLTWPKYFTAEVKNSNEFINEDVCSSLNNINNDRKVNQKIILRLLPFDTRNTDFQRYLYDRTGNRSLLNTQYFIETTELNADNSLSIKVNPSELNRFVESIEKSSNLERHVFETNSLALGCDLSSKDIKLNFKVTALKEVVHTNPTTSSSKLLNISKRLSELFYNAINLNEYTEYNDNSDFNYMLASMKIHQAISDTQGYFETSKTLSETYQILSVLIDKSTGKPKQITKSEA